MLSPSAQTGQRIFPADPQLRERDQRLESLKAVAGKMGHDFNNLLVPILGYMTLIRDEVPPESPAAQYAAAMENAARTGESYLESVLLAMRPHRLFSPKPLDFAALIQTQLELWTRELSPSAGVTVTQQISPCAIWGDERQWVRAIQQLLSNARYALAMGGALQVTLAPENLTGQKLQDLGLRSEKVFTLRISDSGFGMPKAISDRALEPFFTTRAHVRASGLGLTIAHSITQLHGGQIDLESCEDAGTTITIWLPSEQPAFRTPGISGRHSSPEKIAGRILFVEPDPLIREVLRSSLQWTAMEIHIANTGEEGLKLFKQWPANWSLIVSELQLPGMSGPEFLREAEAHQPGVKCILLSAASAMPEQSREKLSPIVLKKPFTLRAFHQVVRQNLSLPT